MIEQIRDAILSADTDNSLNGRVRPGVAAANDSLPFVTIDISDSEAVQTLGSTLGFIRTISINVFAKTRAETRELATMIENAVDDIVDVDGESEIVETIAPESGDAIYSISVRATAYESA